MKKFRKLALLAVIAGLAAYQGRQLHIYAATGQAPATTQNAGPSHGGDAAHPADAAAAAGGSLFQQNCAFCHGRDAGGGETGPDLTRSKLVSHRRGGRQDRGCSAARASRQRNAGFHNFSSEQITNLAAFIHSQQDKAMAQSGKRKGVDVRISRLEMSKLERPTSMARAAAPTCHSPTGDLAGIAVSI